MKIKELELERELELEWELGLGSEILHVNSAMRVSKDKLEDYIEGVWDGEGRWSKVQCDVEDDTLDIAGTVFIRRAIEHEGGYTKRHANNVLQCMLNAGFVKYWCNYVPVSCQSSVRNYTREYKEAAHQRRTANLLK